MQVGNRNKELNYFVIASRLYIHTFILLY